MSTVLDVVELSQKLIRCASVTPNDDGAQDVLISALKPLGFNAIDYSKNGIRNTFFIRDLSSSKKKENAPHFCFAGHTDVVPVGEMNKWSVDPFAATIKDDILYGRGACDMKTGITCFISALSQFLNSDAAKNANGKISLLITGDEEADAIYGTQHVLQELQKEDMIPDMVLVGEPTNPTQHGEEIKPGRRGSLSGSLTVFGKQGHVAYPEKADNPLPKLLTLCQALATYEFDTGNEYFPATNLEFSSIDTGNTTSNVIPAQATTKFNIRFNNQWNAEQLEQKLHEILAQTKIDKDSFALECQSNAESFLTPKGAFTDLVQDAVEHVTDRRPALSTKGGTSDARFIAQYTNVLEYGLINTSAHEIDEHMPLQALHDGVNIYLEILNRVFPPNNQ